MPLTELWSVLHERSIRWAHLLAGHKKDAATAWPSIMVVTFFPLIITIVSPSHSAGSIANLTEADDAEQQPLFACDGGVPQQFSSYNDALYQLGQEDESQKLFDYTKLEATSCTGCFNSCQFGTLENLMSICFANYTDVS